MFEVTTTSTLAPEASDAIVQFNHDSTQALLPEGHKHTAADHGSGLDADTVGEDHVERHGQGNIAILGH